MLYVGRGCCMRGMNHPTVRVALVRRRALRKRRAPFFFRRFPQIWELKTSLPKTVFFFGRENKTALPDEKKNNQMAKVHNENHAEQKKWPIIHFFPDDFGLRNPRHSENKIAKKRYTSIVACVRPRGTFLTSCRLSSSSVGTMRLDSRDSFDECITGISVLG